MASCRLYLSELAAIGRSRYPPRAKSQRCDQAQRGLRGI